MAAETGNLDNPYGIEALWTQSDYVGKGVFVILIYMSLYSWYTIFTKIWDQYALGKVVRDADKNFWNAASLQEGISKLKGKENAIREVAEAGLRAVEHHDLAIADGVDVKNAAADVARHLRRSPGFHQDVMDKRGRRRFAV